MSNLGKGLTLDKDSATGSSFPRCFTDSTAKSKRFSGLIKLLFAVFVIVLDFVGRYRLILGSLIGNVREFRISKNPF